MLPEESGSPTAGYRIADADLDAVLRDLPPAAAHTAPTARFFPDPQAPTRFRARKQWVVAVFGSSMQRGRYRLEDESGALAVFGDCTLDLSDALIEDESPTVNAVAVFGNVTIVVPEGIEVDMSGVAVFGDKRCASGFSRPYPGAPVVHVRAVAVFGDVRVRPPGQGRAR